MWCLGAILCSSATVKPNKDGKLCATLRKNSADASSCSAHKSGRVRTRTPCPSCFHHVRKIVVVAHDIASATSLNVFVSRNRRLQLVPNRTSSSPHQHCFCNLLGCISTKPSVSRCLSRVLRSITFVKKSLILSAVGSFLITKLFAATMSWIHKWRHGIVCPCLILSDATLCFAHVFSVLRNQ